MRWPSQLRRRLCIVMLHSSVLVLVYSSMLVIFLGQCMPNDGKYSLEMTHLLRHCAFVHHNSRLTS